MQYRPKKLFIKLFDTVIKIVKEIGQYCSTHCSMSDISRLMASSPLSHCFARAFFRTAFARRFQAALLAIPALANSPARSFLITSHSCLRCWPYQPISMFDYCVSTRVLGGHFAENQRYDALPALSLDLEMISVR